MFLPSRWCWGLGFLGGFLGVGVFCGLLVGSDAGFGVEEDVAELGVFVGGLRLSSEHGVVNQAVVIVSVRLSLSGFDLLL